MSIYSKNGSAIHSAYGVDGTSINKAYDIDGAVVFQGSQVDYDSFTVNKSYLSTGIANTQGFAYKDGYIFQFRASGTSIQNTVVVINAATGQTVNTFSISSEHGDSASFSNEYYAQGDAFPLLYVTADSNPAKVYVDRVTTSSAELIKTLSFALDKTGYYAAHAYDTENEILYMLGYSEQNYLTDDGGANKVIVSKWNMAQQTQNQDGSYTPLFVSSYERAFIYCMQGQQLYDGMIWIASGYSAGSNIYAMSPSDGTILHTINLETTTEVEGIDFKSDTEMIVGFQGGNYWLYTFART